MIEITELLGSYFKFNNILYSILKLPIEQLFSNFITLLFVFFYINKGGNKLTAEVEKLIKNNAEEQKQRYDNIDQKVTNFDQKMTSFVNLTNEKFTMLEKRQDEKFTTFEKKQERTESEVNKIGKEVTEIRQNFILSVYQNSYPANKQNSNKTKNKKK
jgi:hypothetical protein